MTDAVIEIVEGRVLQGTGAQDHPVVRVMSTHILRAETIENGSVKTGILGVIEGAAARENGIETGAARDATRGETTMIDQHAEIEISLMIGAGLVVEGVIVAIEMLLAAEQDKNAKRVPRLHLRRESQLLI